ncbi:replicative DNA helicase, partial [Streptococcus hyovaginalis]
DYYRKEGEESEEAIEDNTVEVILEKNRAGARGTVKVRFQKENNKISRIAQVEEF